MRLPPSPPPGRRFPPAESAAASGLIGVGGQLDPDWLLEAYRGGIFPWPVQGDLLAWWSPDPRAVLEFDDLHVSRSLERLLRQRKFAVTSNRAFDEVVAGCATAQQRLEGTWLNSDMRAAYQRMHELGHAHSVEVWLDDRLAGGVYGLAIGAAFSAESMFYHERDASKVALVHLVRHLAARGYTLLDIQQLTPHTASLGASEIPRRAFLARLAAARDESITFGAVAS